MDKKIRHICGNIRGGNLPEENIPQLFNHLANHYHIYAEVQLAMHYYAFYEAFYDDENSWGKKAKGIITRLNHMIRDHILQSKSGQAKEEIIRSVDSIRNEIMHQMNVLTTYTDMFQIYEYVLNRVEYRFKEELEPIEEKEFSKEILRFIFDSEDNMIINEKIKEIIGQLPIRITKQKFFELLKESIHAYLGSEGSVLDNYLYQLRTSAMLNQVEDMASIYPALWEKKEFLSHLEYKDITKKNYDKALRMLQAATLTLETETTVYIGLQEIVNEIYAILLNSSYAGMVNSAEESGNTAVHIIREINNVFCRNEKNELSEELMDRFTDLEGVQEELSYEIDLMQDALFDISSNYETITKSLMLESVMNVLLRSSKLLSNSIFIELDEEKEDKDNTVDEERVEEEAKAMEQQLTAMFSGQDKMINRAIIANTINKMPVFFKNHKEVMDYVLYSLERCSDKYEKSACVEIINAIMSE